MISIRLLSIGAACAVIGMQVAADPIQLVSKKAPTFPASATASGISFSGVFDPARNSVIFASSADNLQPTPKRFVRTDIFAFNNTDGKIVRLTTPTDGGLGAASTSYPVGVSGDTLVYISDAPDLLPSGTNGPIPSRQVYAQNLLTGSRRLLTKNPSTGSAANSGILGAILAANARYVIIETASNDLAGHPENSNSQIYRIDLQNGDKLDLVSTGSDGVSPGPRPARDSVVSADGNTIAFNVDAFDPTDSISSTVLIRDMISGVTTPVIVGASTNRVAATDVQISASGQFLALRRHGSKVNSENGVYWVDLHAGTNAYCSASLPAAFGGDTNYFSPIAIFPNGRTLAFEGLLPDSSERIWFWNADTGTATGFDGLLLTVPPTSTEPPISFQPVVNPDGNSVAFLSDAAGIVPGVDEGGVHLYIRSLASGHTTLVSHSPDGTPAEVDSVVINYAFGSDGTQMEIETDSPGLVQNDLNQSTDVFLYDLANDRIGTISAAAPGLQDISPDASSSILPLCLSQNGRFIVFESSASDLATNAVVGNFNVFLTDRLLNITTLVSVNTNGDSSVGSASSTPQITPDGRYVLFFSAAADLTSDTPPRRINIFLRDMQAGMTTLVSPLSATDPGTFGISHATMSDDGRYIAYETGFIGVLRDLAQQTSTKIGGASGFSNGGTTQIAKNGSKVAFLSNSGLIGAESLPSGAVVTSNLPLTGGLARRIDLSADGATAVTHDFMGFIIIDTKSQIVRRLPQFPPSVAFHDWTFAPGGTWVVFSARGAANVASPNYQLFSLNITNGATALLTTNFYGAPGNGSSVAASISDNGRYVTFKSEASDLVAHDDNGTQDIFVCDLATGGIALVSRSLTGVSANDRSLETCISPDGSVIAFTSAASDLVVGAYNGFPNLFAADVSVPLPDSDADGLPDQWELQFFGDLSQGPNDDPDHDGASNLNEFFAHTDPTDPHSYLHLNIPAVSFTDVNLSWQTMPGVQYQIQSEDNLGPASWQNLSSQFLGDGSQAAYSTPLPSGGAQLYRLVVLPPQ